MDQAQTLRELMRERSEQEQAAAVPRVFTFIGVRPGVGSTTLLANLSAIFARSGWRVAAVDLGNPSKSEEGPVNLAVALGAEPALTRDSFVQVEEDLWLVSPKPGVPVAGPETAEMVFLDGRASSEPPGETKAGAETVIVLTPDRKDIDAATELLRKRRGAGIIVNQARDGLEAQKVFRSLKGDIERIPDLRVEYLGHCGRDEKIFQAVRKRKILLDLDSGAPSVRCFELLAKRFRARYLDEAGVEDDRIVIRRRHQTSRFREEPARSAPGNGTGFWRTLLGEVKA